MISKKEWTLDIDESNWKDLEGYTDDGEIKKSIRIKLDRNN